MAEHAIYKVLRSAPINQVARRAVRQADCSFNDSALSRSELNEMLARMHRKARLLRQVLGLDTKAKQKNFRSIMNGTRSGSGYGRAKANKRSAVEYIRLGQEIHRLGVRIAELKQEEAAS